MSQIFHRQISAVPLRASHANGVYIYDNQGSEFLDACGGAAVSSLGHNHPAIVRAIQNQAQDLAYVHSSFFTSDVAETLADKLVALAPSNLNHVVFSSGGSEGMETAIKLARQYFYERGESSRKYLISRQQSYHGATMGMLSVGQHFGRRQPFLPLLNSSHSISVCHPYRHQLENETEFDYAMRIANELEAKLIELGPENVIGFVAETVGGATGGVLPPVNGYLKRIRQICDDYGILLILDEVMCGSGRTGSFYAFNQEDISPDLVVLAKGLGAGYQPIAATLCSGSIFSGFAKGSGALIHSFTYMGHTIACAAALAVLNVIESENLLENVKKQGQYLMTQLANELHSHPHVGDIRGRGLFIGVEFVADRESKTPIDSKKSFHKHFKQMCMNNGLMLYTGSGTVDGTEGDHVLIAPAYIIDHKIVDKIVHRFKKSLDQAIAAAGVT